MTLNYPEKITTFDPAYTMSMVDPIVIDVKIQRIDNGYFSENNELIHVNPRMVLYLTINQVDSCHDYKYIYGP